MKQMRDVAAYNQQDVLGDGCFLFEFHWISKPAFFCLSIRMHELTLHVKVVSGIR